MELRRLNADERVAAARMSEEYCNRLQEDQCNYRIKLAEMSAEHSTTMDTALTSYKASQSLVTSLAAVQQDQSLQLVTLRLQLSQQAANMESMQQQFQEKLDEVVQQRNEDQERFTTRLNEATEQMTTRIDQLQTGILCDTHTGIYCRPRPLTTVSTEAKG